jgi:hypothetical protein
MQSPQMQEGLPGDGVESQFERQKPCSSGVGKDGNTQATLGDTDSATNDY